MEMYLKHLNYKSFNPNLKSFNYVYTIFERKKS